MGYDAGLSRYLPALDGLRALSISLVLLSHLGLRQLVPGGFGVTVFFFISGLLIGRQLLEEKRASGRIRLGGFFMRRILRLYPALVVMVVLGGTVFSALGGRVVWPQVAAALFYGVNWMLLSGGLPSGLADDYHPYSILWSLAIEEQVYFLLPLLVMVAGGWRRFDLVLVGLIVGLSAWRVHVTASCELQGVLCLGTNAADRIAYGTDTRLDGFLYGVLLAVLFGVPAVRGVLRSRMAMLLAAGLLVVSFAVRAEWFRQDAMLVVQGISLFLGVGWLLAGDAQGWVRRVLSARAAVLVGRWSYSLYLWHWVVMVCGAAWLAGGLGALTGEGRPGFSLPVFMPALLAASFGLACASYYLVERPTLRWRKRFGSVALSGDLAADGVGEGLENPVDMRFLGDQRR